MNSEQIEQQNEKDIINKNFELAHIIGLNITSAKSLQCHPSMQESVIYSVGGIIISEDLMEKNNQIFFRHGNNKINCFRISNTGKYLAVGFTTGEENYDKDLLASIILWDYENKKILYEIREIYKAVTILEFSQDDKFFSAAGLDNTFYTWEVSNGYKCFHRVYECPVTFIHWTKMFKSRDTIQNRQSNYYDYTITITNNSALSYLDFYFELRTMQYNVRNNNFVLPSTGFNRDYTCGFYDEKYNCLYLGTAAGELIIFSLDNLYFKSSFNITNNGVTDMVFLSETEEILVSGGDGKIKKIQRSMPEGETSKDILKAKHLMTYETLLPGKINSISLTSDQKEIVCVSDIGKIFRVLTNNLNYTLHSTAHSSSINGIAFNEAGNINDICYTVDNNGNCYQFDLNDFGVMGFIPANDDENANAVNIPQCTSVCIADDQSIFLGYSSGNIKNFTNDLSTKLFDIPAHRGKVNCIYVDGNYILTGGEDGIVRVWSRTNHELIMQIPAHHSNVRNVFADRNKPNIIFSCGDDRELGCYDLKLQKRVTTQSIPNGIICGISQKVEQEYEIISVGINCNLCIWDFFKTEPVREINLGERMICIQISHSGKYFAVGSASGEVWLFKLPECEFIGKSQGHSREVTGLNWSPDDKQIISISNDSSICVWNIYI
ncbi:MAG: WD40 repeat domain-containing protein [archaeon]|nr:WD40 repeat domain-containing protein [archaeon]